MLPASHPAWPWALPPSTLGDGAPLVHLQPPESFDSHTRHANEPRVPYARTRRTTQHPSDGPSTLHELKDPQLGEKPDYSYPILIRCAILSHRDQRPTLSEIYDMINERFEWYRMDDASWKNSIRHYLSISPSFVKVPRPITEPGKGSYWKYDPNPPPKPARKRPARKRKPSAQKHQENAAESAFISDATICPAPRVRSTSTSSTGRSSRGAPGIEPGGGTSTSSDKDDYALARGSRSPHGGMDDFPPHVRPNIHPVTSTLSWLEPCTPSTSSLPHGPHRTSALAKTEVYHYQQPPMYHPTPVLPPPQHQHQHQYQQPYEMQQVYGNYSLLPPVQTMRREEVQAGYHPFTSVRATYGPHGDAGYRYSQQNGY